MTNIHHSRTSPELDLNWAKDFLGLLDPEAEEYCFQTFDDGEGKAAHLAKCWHARFDDAQADLLALNEQGAGVFVSVNETDGKGRKTENIKRVRAVVLDLDGEPLEPVWECALKPSLVVETSPGRWHAYWFLLDGLPVEQFEGVQRAIAKRFNGDPAVAKLTHVARLPGFLHQKGEPFLVRIVEPKSRSGKFGFMLRPLRRSAGA